MKAAGGEKPQVYQYDEEKKPFKGREP